MTDATFFDMQPRAKEVTLPKPQPFSAPVFITDAVSPLAGETVLSLIWKRFERDADQAE